MTDWVGQDWVGHDWLGLEGRAAFVTGHVRYVDGGRALV